MSFVEINGTMFNSDTIGEVIPNSRELKITYRFEGGRTIVEEFENDSDFDDRISQIGNL